MNKCCIIIPYFGKWPSYFSIYLNSCKFNAWLDILFFTDIPPPQTYPENVRFSHLTLDEIGFRLQKKLDLPVALSESYKLCDIRPAYGILFQDYIANYEFWGYGDIDVVMGRGDHFLTPDLLKSFDIISVRKEWCSGSFSLLRNTAVVNGLFKEDEGFKNVFLSEDYCGFDECAKLFDNYRRGVVNYNDSPPNFTNIVRRASDQKRIKVHFETLIKESIKPEELVCWEEGKIEDGQKEYLLYHYISEKKKYSFSFPNWKKVPRKFFIDNTGFYNENELKNKEMLRLKRITVGLLRFIMDIIPRAKKKYSKIKSI